MANSIVLGISTLVVGLIFLRTAGSRAPRSQRIVGIIQIAYVPSYVASVSLDLAGLEQRDWLSLIPLLSDQALLGVLNIALLSMPGERAEADLRERALRDPLTGAWNRAGLDYIGELDPGVYSRYFSADFDEDHLSLAEINAPCVQRFIRLTFSGSIGTPVTFQRCLQTMLFLNIVSMETTLGAQCCVSHVWLACRRCLYGSLQM